MNSWVLEKAGDRRKTVSFSRRNLFQGVSFQRIYLEKRRKMTKSFYHGSRFPGRDVNPSTPGYETECQLLCHYGWSFVTSVVLWIVRLMVGLCVLSTAPWRCIYRTVELKLHAFLTSTLYCGEWHDPLRTILDGPHNWTHDGEESTHVPAGFRTPVV
jgi:hypothetical protein